MNLSFTGMSMLSTIYRIHQIGREKVELINGHTKTISNTSFDKSFYKLLKFLNIIDLKWLLLSREYASISPHTSEKMQMDRTRFEDKSWQYLEDCTNAGT